MELQENIEELIEDIDEYKLRLKELEYKLELYTSLEDIKMPNLSKELSEIKGLINQKTKGFSIYFENDNIIKELGGDGRSAPSEKEIDGLICSIQTTYYLTEFQKDFIEQYLQSFGSIDKIGFKYVKSLAE